MLNSLCPSVGLSVRGVSMMGVSKVALVWRLGKVKCVRAGSVRSCLKVTERWNALELKVGKVKWAGNRTFPLLILAKRSPISVATEHLFLFCRVLYYAFFSIQRLARTARQIFTPYCSNDVLQPKGLERWVTSFGENVPQRPTKRDANRHFQAILRKSKNCNISEIWRQNSNHHRHVVGVLPLPYRKYNITDVRHLQNWHNVVARSPTVHFT